MDEESPVAFMAAHWDNDIDGSVPVQDCFWTLASCMISHVGELCSVDVNDTFLEGSIDAIVLGGFVFVGRRKRSYNGDDRSFGGVVVFANAAIASHVTRLNASEVSERLWFQLHTNSGPYLLCAWHRPPVTGAGEVE